MTARLMRVWRGQTKQADAEEYEEYMRQTGFAGYLSTEGNRGVYLTRRDIGENTEFCFVTFWDDWDSIKAFAGDDPGKAVYYSEDERFLVVKGPAVDHYDIVEST